MKTLFFASDFNIGLSTLLTDQLIALAKNEIDVYAVAGEKEQEEGLSKKIEKNGIVITRIQGLDTHHHFKKLAHQLKKNIQHQQIQTIHVQNNWQLALIVYTKYILLQNREIKIVYTLHGFRHNNSIKASIAQLVIGTALLLFADKIICMCSFLKRKFKLLSYKIEIIPLGVSDTFFEEKYPPLPINGLQMIFPAQFRKGKNQNVIIRAFAKHLQNTNDIDSKLILPGAGSLLDEMKQLVHDYQLENRVIFPGLCSKREIKDWYLKSNIGIIASNSETFGQSIVEPFVLGRCIITTRVGIAPDIIVHGENGYFFKDEQELISIFTSIYKNQKVILQAGLNNYSVRESFSWAKISRLYKEQILR